MRCEYNNNHHHHKLKKKTYIIKHLAKHLSHQREHLQVIRRDDVRSRVGVESVLFIRKEETKLGIEGGGCKEMQKLLCEAAAMTNLR